MGNVAIMLPGNPLSKEIGNYQDFATYRTQQAVISKSKQNEALSKEFTTIVANFFQERGSAATVPNGTVPVIMQPAQPANSNVLTQQVQAHCNALSLQLTQLRTDPVTEQTESHASPVGAIDFSAPNVQRQDSSAATGEQGAGQSAATVAQGARQGDHSKPGSGLLDGKMSALTALLAMMITVLYASRNADRESAVNASIISFESTLLAAHEEFASGKARQKALITSSVTQLSVTGLGTAQTHRGIKAQKKALNNHKVPALEHQSRATELNQTAQARHGGQLADAHAGESSAANFADDTPDRIQRDHEALIRPAENHQRQYSEHMIEYEDMQLTGQLQQQYGHAITTAAAALGGIAGSQFDIDAAQAQADRQIAEGNARTHDSTHSNKEKQVEAALAIIAALMAAMQQAATANNDAASTVANNMAR